MTDRMTTQEHLTLRALDGVSTSSREEPCRSNYLLTSKYCTKMTPAKLKPCTCARFYAGNLYI